MDTSPQIEMVGSRRGRRKVRITIEGPPGLKSRLEALAFEAGMTVAEIGRYSLWLTVLEAEGNPKKFCQKVARERLRHVQEERGTC